MAAVAAVAAVAAAGLLTAPTAALATPGVPAAATLPGTATPAATVAPGPLTPVELYTFTDLNATTAGWRITGKGDGPTDSGPAPVWTVTLDLSMAETCFGTPFPFVIGLMKRDGVGAFGGHVGTLRTYQQVDSDYVPARDFPGITMLDCLINFYPTIVPLNSTYTITSGQVSQFWPAGVGAADGHYDLVSQSTGFGYVVNEYLPGRGWQPPTPIGGAGSAPTILRLPNGGARIFVIGTNRALYTADITPDRRFGGWKRIGGYFNSTVSPVLMSYGTVAVYGQGGNDHLYQGNWDIHGTFRGWVDLGAPPKITGGQFGIVGRPAAASTGNGNVSVAVVNVLDYEYWTRSYHIGHGWGSWVDLHQTGQADLTAVSTGPGKFSIFWLGNESTNFLQVMTRTATNDHWGQPVLLGGQLLFGGPTASNAAGQVDLWGETAHYMYQRRYMSGSWHPWARLPFGGH